MKFTARNEKIIPILIFLLFLAASIPGIKWGLPALWNPDELVWRVDKALHGEMIFDKTEPDYNYPSLPKYIMYGIGKLVYGMGYSSSRFIMAARGFSALLGALSGVLIYYLARMIGTNQSISALAGLFYILSGVASANSRFAHNDLYLQFFVILCVYCAVKYQFTKQNFWIYTSFFMVGLSASSKYTGGSILLLPVFTLMLTNKKSWARSLLALLVGGALSYAGYVVGTPQAIHFFEYFSNVAGALQRYPQYGFNSGSPIGLYGQWSVFKEAVGEFEYYFFIICFVWYAIQLVLWKIGKARMDDKQAQSIITLIAAVLIFDLPFMVSINYIPRYFIPFVPFLSILGALFIKDIFDLTYNKNWNFARPVINIVLMAGIFYSALRLVSIALLFINDARIPASEYITTIRGYKTLVEYTLYPPYVNKKQFYGSARNYPIYFVKYKSDVVPTSGGRFELNQGEQGLIDRDVDYFIIDSLTYSRFYTDSICETNPVECDFFKRLLAGQVTTFQLEKDFVYSLPPWLPYASITAVNPEIRIYQRVR